MEEISLDDLNKIRRNRKELGKEVIFIKKEDNRLYKMTEEEIQNFKHTKRNKSSICFDCIYSWPVVCPKIGERGYRRIEKYPFINCGIEIISSNSAECNTFVIGCKKYKKECRKIEKEK